MKKLTLFAGLLATTLALPGSALAHGGTYRGPGDTVPPAGGGGGAGGAAGPATGPIGPTVPGSGPTTGGPAVPGMPGSAPGGQAGPSTGSDATGGDLEAWQFWWGFNKDGYLNLKAAIHSSRVVTGSDDFFIGRGETKDGQNLLSPNEDKVRQVIVPALLEALASEDSNDIVTGCLIALAKIGDAKDEQGASRFEQVIKQFLKHKNQEIAETAAVSLGILANEASIETLTALVWSDPERARELVGAPEVDYRTRAFAAYGLGLIGYRTQDNALRQTIVRTLIDVLETTRLSTRDLHVAAVIALGLVPLDAGQVPATAEGEAPVQGEAPGQDSAYWASTRATQVRYLLRFFRDAEANHYLVRAHAPRALAKLLAARGSEPLRDPALREEVARALLSAVSKHSKEKNEVLQSAVLAMGQLADLDDDKVDVEMRKTLLERVDSGGEGQTNRFALISLAQLCGNPGSGEGAGASYDEVARRMTRWLGQTGGGKSRLKPWIGLALGVMQRARSEANLAPSREVAQALRAALTDCNTPGDLGAYCLATGISKDLAAKPIVVDKLERFADDEARGYAALSLGLMNASDQVTLIQRIVKESKYRPELLKQAAIALGLLGDQRLVEDLIAMLGEAKSLSTQAAISSALGFIGDSRSIDPLVEMLANKEITASARGFAAVALGIVADKEDLPWNSKVSRDINYRANTTTLTGLNGTGILDIL